MASLGREQIMVFAIQSSADYWPQAQVLIDSILRFHSRPNTEIYVQWFGPGSIPTKQEVTFLTPEDCREQEPLSHYKNVADRIAANRPAFLLKLLALALNRSQFVVLGADCLLFAPIHPLSLLGDFLMTMAPHCLKPLPDDGKCPDNHNIIKAGYLNCDMIAFLRDDRTRLFLTWLNVQLETGILRDADDAAHSISDQSWWNFAPSFVPAFKINRHPGYNVAYWNLHERPLTKKGQMLFAWDRPLVVLHFSGFDCTQDPDGAIELSRYQNRIEPAGILLELCRDYLKKVQTYGY